MKLSRVMKESPSFKKSGSGCLSEVRAFRVKVALVAPPQFLRKTLQGRLFTRISTFTLRTRRIGELHSLRSGGSHCSNQLALQISIKAKSSYVAPALSSLPVQTKAHVGASHQPRLLTIRKMHVRFLMKQRIPQ